MKKSLIEELTFLVHKTTLACTIKQRYETCYNLFVFVYNNSILLYTKYPRLYHQMNISKKNIFNEINDKNDTYEELNQPLKCILIKLHYKYIDNYINMLGSVPGDMPLELKKNIISFL